MITKPTFLKSVFVLLSGTAMAHVITALALPIATRLYTPEDFSVLAVYSGFVFMISVAASLRFDVAVSIAQSDEDATNLLALALILAFAFATAVLALLFVVPHGVRAWFGLAPIDPYRFWIPLGILLTAIYGALQAWHVRRSSFALISRSRVVQSASGASGQVAFGLMGAGAPGLLVGFLLSPVIGCIALGYKLLFRENKLFSSTTAASLHSTFIKFSRFPKYSTLEALSNSASIQLPVIMIAAWAIGPEAGFLMLAMSVMQAPMAMVGHAVGQVYLSRAPEEYRNSNLRAFTLQTFEGLCRVGIGPLLFIGIVSPYAFALVFGEDWRRAGVIVSWMTPWFIAQFLSAPLSMSVHVTGHQAAAMRLQIFGLALRVSSVWFASAYALTHLVEAYAISGLIFYMFYLALIKSVVHLPSIALLRMILSCWFGIVTWAVLGLAINQLLATFVAS